ncbi:unnamed protein product [Toxocara canis]|uniref:AMPKBI domain-containing protein n=1 Tax=Toxocara canis TaxID=6265 RepID=A0A183UVT2_TOXCA|nr:unnamed protein product [Toxocara canis]
MSEQEQQPDYSQYDEDSIPPNIEKPEIKHTHPGRPDLDYDDMPVGHHESTEHGHIVNEMLSGDKQPLLVNLNSLAEQKYIAPELSIDQFTPALSISLIHFIAAVCHEKHTVYAYHDSRI